MKQARDLLATLRVKAEVMNRAKVSRTLKAHLSRHSGLSNAAINTNITPIYATILHEH